MRAKKSQRIAINIIKWGMFAAVMGLLVFMLTKGTGSASAAAPDTIRANVTAAADTGYYLNIWGAHDILQFVQIEITFDQSHGKSPHP